MTDKIIVGDIVRLRNTDADHPFSGTNFVVKTIKPGGWYNISDGMTMLLNIPERNILKVEHTLVPPMSVR